VHTRGVRGVRGRGDARAWAFFNFAGSFLSIHAVFLSWLFSTKKIEKTLIPARAQNPEKPHSTVRT